MDRLGDRIIHATEWMPFTGISMLLWGKRWYVLDLYDDYRPHLTTARIVTARDWHRGIDEVAIEKDAIRDLDTFLRTGHGTSDNTMRFSDGDTLAATLP